MLFEGSEDQYFVGLRQGLDGRHYIAGIIFFHLPARNGRKGSAGTREEKTQIIIDLGHAAYRRSRGPGNDFLLDGDGRAESFNIVHVRLVHTRHELPGIGAETFRIAPLSLGKQGVDGK